MMISMLLLVLALAQHDAHAKDRATMAMGFDQDKTAHHFLLYDDGGAIDIAVKDAGDTADRDAIRSHLPHIAAMFGDGDFDVPMLVHDTKDVPGTAVLSARKAAISYRYRETPRGGRVDIVTSDREALAALHDFLRYQIHEHQTGDPAVPGPRKRP
jgi:hypothetical protein